jgi:hypothetical protein
MTLGYRIEAIAILGREVMLPRGLVGLGFDTIDLCGNEIAEVVCDLLLSTILVTIYSVFVHLRFSQIMGF